MTSRVSILEVALGLEVQKKRLIEHLYECPIIGQPSRDDEKMKREDIQRLKKQQLYKIQLSDIEIKTFVDEKKTKMPALLGKSGALPFKVLCHKIIIQRRASQENFLFLKSSVINPSTPDFSGYNQGNWSEFKSKMKFILPCPD